MQYFLTGKRMQAADRYTIETLGIPSLTLMERAAEACVNIMEAEGIDLSKPCVVCGSGNNGGDGFAIARMLSERGHTVGMHGRKHISLYRRDILSNRKAEKNRHKDL